MIEKVKSSMKHLDININITYEFPISYKVVFLFHMLANIKYADFAAV